MQGILRADFYAREVKPVAESLSKDSESLKILFEDKNLKLLTVVLENVIGRALTRVELRGKSLRTDILPTADTSTDQSYSVIYALKRVLSENAEEADFRSLDRFIRHLVKNFFEDVAILWDSEIDDFSIILMDESNPIDLIEKKLQRLTHLIVGSEHSLKQASNPLELLSRALSREIHKSILTLADEVQDSNKSLEILDNQARMVFDAGIRARAKVAEAIVDHLSVSSSDADKVIDDLDPTRLDGLVGAFRKMFFGHPTFNLDSFFDFRSKFKEINKWVDRIYSVPILWSFIVEMAVSNGDKEIASKIKDESGIMGYELSMIQRIKAASYTFNSLLGEGSNLFEWLIRIFELGIDYGRGAQDYRNYLLLAARWWIFDVTLSEKHNFVGNNLTSLDQMYSTYLVNDPEKLQSLCDHLATLSAVHKHVSNNKRLGVFYKWMESGIGQQDGYLRFTLDPHGLAMYFLAESEEPQLIQNIS